MGIFRKGAVPLAVGAVRNLETLLMRAARKHKLTADERQRLKKCAAHLRRKRENARVGSNIVLPWWLCKITLHLLAKMLKGRKHIQKVITGLLGG